MSWTTGFPVHLDPVAVGVEAFERHAGGFVVALRNGDARALHVGHQGAHLIGPGEP